MTLLRRLAAGIVWEHDTDDWLLELGNFYVHWNAPPCPSLWVGWMGAHPWAVWLSATWGEDA